MLHLQLLDGQQMLQILKEFDEARIISLGLKKK